jgi:hypothetical protein
MNGESIVLANAGTAVPPAEPDGDPDRPEESEGAEAGAAASTKGAAAGVEDAGNADAPPRGSKPGVTVNLNVDSSSDPDKLEKQLKLLREFGVI